MTKTIKLDTASKRYAFALYSVAQNSDKIEQIKEEFSHIIEGFKAIPAWNSLNGKNTVDNKEKAAHFLDAIAKFNVIPELENFFKVLSVRNRAVFLPEIYKEFINIYNSKKSIEVVNIESATSLGDAEKEKIKDFILKQNTRVKEVELNEVVNEDLISGFKFMFDAKLYDSSMKQKLENLRKTLR